MSAAGNEAADIDDPNETPRYPQLFTMDNLIVLGNSDLSDQRSSNSNWGMTSVDVFATGETSAFDENPSHSPSNIWPGTSNSAAYTSGLASLVWTLNPSWTPLQVKQRLMNTAEPLSVLSGLCVSGARINAAAAVGQTCP